jgi:transposase-like protein
MTTTTITTTTTETSLQTTDTASQSLKFCSSCSREKRLEGGTWIPTSNKKQRWICASCLYNRTHRTGSAKE